MRERLDDAKRRMEGATKAFVNATCAIVGGIPVSPPVDPAAAPQIAVVPPKGV